MIAGRALNSAAVAFLAAAVAIALCVALSTLPRTAAGITVAAGMIAAGDLIARRKGSRTGSRSDTRAFWCGTTTMATGYALAAFFAHAGHYVSAVSGFQSPFPCWFLELALAAVATVHGSRNSVLRFLTVPFTLLATGNVLYHALTATDSVSLLGLDVGVSAIASVVGVLWFAALTALHQKLEASYSKAASDNLVEKASWLMHRVTHELYFVLAAVNALALPKFCGSIENAPLWWAIETPVLLAISWRSRSFIKHALVMGIWALSAVLLLSTKMDLSPVVRMAIPVSGIVMALTYRYVQSSWAHWQKKIGYSVYLYGSVGVAVALPLFQMTPLEALPYWLAQSGVVAVLALALQDKVLQRTGAVAGAGTLALFASQWQNWTCPNAIAVIAGCYALSLTYGYYKRKGGVGNSEYVPWPGKQTLTAKQAGWMEKGTGGLGYSALIASSFLLIATPYNTMAWGIEAFSLIAFGFLTRKVGHRASGLLAMALASAKLTIFDLSGAGTLLRTLVSFGAIGACCIAAGIFYLVEYGRLQKSVKDDDTTGGDNA